MAKKTAVIISSTGEKVPFLRGILVQSLAEAGLDFEDAYAMAQRVRDALAKVEGVRAAELRGLVAELLEQHLGVDVRRSYEAGQAGEREIIVRSPSRSAPFSVGLLSRHLEGCALEREQALQGARTVQEILRLRDSPHIEAHELRLLVYDTLKKECCAIAGDRYLSRCLFEDSRQPLIVLVGGAPGSGKSTVSARVAYMLDIPHTQSTDMMREIIRCYLAQPVVPTLGYSSFEAWRGLPEVDLQSGKKATNNTVIAGFLSQAELVRVALEATIARALKEHQDIIVNGVHVLPSHLNLEEARKTAVVVQVTLAVTTLKRLGRQLQRRSREQPNRDSSHHRENLQAIWDIQTFMLDKAELSKTPVIVNWNPDETVRLILEQVMEEITRRFPPDPDALVR